MRRKDDWGVDEVEIAAAEARTDVPPVAPGPTDVKGRHPAGLTTLFLTEMWERFSYYGMRAILVLFMVAPPAQGGLGFSTKDAASLYGTYTMAVYLLALPGGYVGDRFLAPRQAVLLGGLLMAAGQFLLTVHA